MRKAENDRFSALKFNVYRMNATSIELSKSPGPIFSRLYVVSIASYVMRGNTVLLLVSELTLKNRCRYDSYNHKKNTEPACGRLHEEHEATYVRNSLACINRLHLVVCNGVSVGILNRVTLCLKVSAIRVVFVWLFNTNDSVYQ